MPPRIVEDLPEDQKRCCTCKLVKHVDEFHKSSVPREWKGRKPRCKECCSKNHAARYAAKTPEQKTEYNNQTAAWYAANATLVLLKRLAKKYSLTVERVKQMIEEQQGLCALCGKRSVIRTDSSAAGLNIDHDHTCCPGDKSCGKCVRKLLCHSCNVGLGMLGDDPDLMRKGADYIEWHREDRRSVHVVER